jgi:hypothetical protein
MFERGRATSYSACGIPYWIGGTVGTEAELVARTPDQHRAMGVDVRMRTEVTGIDLDRRVVRWRDLEGGANVGDPSSFYGGTDAGYIDYPRWRRPPDPDGRPTDPTRIRGPAGSVRTAPVVTFHAAAGPRPNR